MSAFMRDSGRQVCAELNKIEKREVTNDVGYQESTGMTLDCVMLAIKGHPLFAADFQSLCRGLVPFLGKSGLFPLWRLSSPCKHKTRLLYKEDFLWFILF